MARSQIGKLKLTVTKLERKRGKMAKHIEKSIAAISYLDKVIATYKEAISLDEPEGEPTAVPPKEGTVEVRPFTKEEIAALDAGGSHENIVSNS